MSTSPDSLTPRSPSTIDFLPSPTTTATSSADAADDRDVSDADREWRESLQQLELLLTMVLIPYVGKYFGRKLAFWSESPSQAPGSPWPAGRHFLLY